MSRRTHSSVGERSERHASGPSACGYFSSLLTSHVLWGPILVRFCATGWGILTSQDAGNKLRDAVSVLRIMPSSRERLFRRIKRLLHVLFSVRSAQERRLKL